MSFTETLSTFSLLISPTLQQCETLLQCPTLLLSHVCLSSFVVNALSILRKINLASFVLGFSSQMCAYRRANARFVSSLSFYASFDAVTLSQFGICVGFNLLMIDICPIVLFSGDNMKRYYWKYVILGKASSRNAWVIISTLLWANCHFSFGPWMAISEWEIMRNKLSEQNLDH